MRYKLKEIHGQKRKFTGVFRCIGKFKKGKGSAALVEDIKLAKTGEVVADHLWIRNGKWTKNIPSNFEISFTAMVIKYTVDPNGRFTRQDYKVGKPEVVKVNWRLGKVKLRDEV